MQRNVRNAKDLLEYFIIILYLVDDIQISS